MMALFAELRKKKGLMWGIVAAVILIAAGLTLWLVLGQGTGKTPQGGTRSALNRPKAEEYMAENGEIVGTVPAKSAGTALTEAEALRAFTERGFTQYPLTYVYDMDGKYTGEQEARANGSARHPYYSCYYMTEDGVGWRISAAGSAFFAEPLSYLDQAGWEVRHLVAERATILDYDSASNAYYEIRPDPAALVLKQVRRIDAATLAGLTLREVDAP